MTATVAYNLQSYYGYVGVGLCSGLKMFDEFYWKVLPAQAKTRANEVPSKFVF